MSTNAPKVVTNKHKCKDGGNNGKAFSNKLKAHKGKLIMMSLQEPDVRSYVLSVWENTNIKTILFLKAASMKMGLEEKKPCTRCKF